jgi:hypothetical protein
MQPLLRCALLLLILATVSVVRRVAVTLLLQTLASVPRLLITHTHTNNNTTSYYHYRQTLPTSTTLSRSHSISVPLVLGTATLSTLPGLAARQLITHPYHAARIRHQRQLRGA